MKEKSEKPPSLLPNHERPLGRFLNESKGEPFHPLRSFDDARSRANGYVVLQGDDGGQIYVVAPTCQVQCSQRTLKVLLRELDEIAWPGNEESMRRVYYERLEEGACVAGGMGGGIASAAPWVHQEFVSMGLEQIILSVLSGERTSIR